jgi:hypothetical protein
LAKVEEEEGFVAPEPKVMKLFAAVIYKCSQQARVFVPGKPF